MGNGDSLDNLLAESTLVDTNSTLSPSLPAGLALGIRLTSSMNASAFPSSKEPLLREMISRLLNAQIPAAIVVSSSASASLLATVALPVGASTDDVRSYQTTLRALTGKPLIEGWDVVSVDETLLRAAAAPAPSGNKQAQTPSPTAKDDKGSGV